MLIQPTFFEALLLQRPDIEKIVKKDYQISKKNIKKRLQLCESLEERIEVLEEAISFIEQVWEKEGVTFMIQVLDTPMYKINRGEYQFRIERSIDLNEAILKDTPFFYPQNLSKLDGGFTVCEDFNLVFPHFALKAYSYKKPDGFFTTIAEIKYFRMCMFFLKRELTKYKEELAKTATVNEDDYIRLNRSKRKPNDGVTKLGTNQTALFAQYMQKADVILNEHKGLNDKDAAKALQVLTNISFKQMRTPLGDEDKIKFKKDDFIKVKEALECMLKYVNDDLPKARK